MRYLVVVRSDRRNLSTDECDSMIRDTKNGPRPRIQRGVLSLAPVEIPFPRAQNFLRFAENRSIAYHLLIHPTLHHSFRMVKSPYKKRA